MNTIDLYQLPIFAAVKGSQSEIPAGQWWATFVVAVAAIVGMLLFSYRTRAGIIARATTKEAIRQPIFFLLLFVSLLILIVNTFLPFFSLGEDIKMLKDCGLVTMLFSGLFLAVWTSSTSVANEIEGKTAMTLLSKPINRRQFVVGKYVGILQAVLILVVPLVLIFFLLLLYKVGYDARESSKQVPEWGFQAMTIHPERLQAVIQILPGVALILLEIAVLTAVSVAISIRLPMVVNITTCLAIFVVGHLTPVLVAYQPREGVNPLEPVKFVAQLIATALPSLNIFNMEVAVATGAMVPPIYLLYSAIYSVAYCTAAILMAFILFEDRDLA